MLNPDVFSSVLLSTNDLSVGLAYSSPRVLFPILVLDPPNTYQVYYSRPSKYRCTRHHTLLILKQKTFSCRQSQCCFIAISLNVAPDSNGFPSVAVTQNQGLRAALLPPSTLRIVLSVFAVRRGRSLLPSPTYVRWYVPAHFVSPVPLCAFLKVSTS